MPDAPLPDLETLDAEALKGLIIAQREQISSHTAEIERLRLLIIRLQRMQFGPKSEKLQPHIEQLQLQLDDLETTDAERKRQAENGLPPAAAAIFAAVTKKTTSQTSIAGSPAA